MSHINIEIKARSKDPNKIRKILKEKGSRFIGTDHQIDTYFKVANGRLKLRKGNIENYLIYYQRQDKKGPKQSDVILYKTTSKSLLENILIKALGVFKIVDKKREIYFIKNVKFHIDQVRGLGSFIEIEAIDKTGKIGKEKLLEQCNQYLKLFNVSQSDLISKSYSDLLNKQ
ncbi:MAG: class IV adenylate cyclase [Parcubacteria group bacterium]|nr:class IV adenylate cyclase [Parcubacteria group bacterium]